jgi:hypothetical protein
VDHRRLRCSSRAKKAAAFRISRSSSSTRTRRRSLDSSALLGGQPVALSSIELGLADALAKRLEGHAEIASDHAQLRPRLASQWNGLNLELRRVRRSGPPSQRGLLLGAERPQLPGVHRTGSRPGQASDHARERARRTGTQPRWAGRRSPSASSRRRRTGEPAHGSRQPSTPYGTRRRGYTPMAGYRLTGRAISLDAVKRPVERGTGQGGPGCEPGRPEAQSRGGIGPPILLEEHGRR